MFKKIEDTREYRVRELYADYCAQHEAKMARYAPTKLNWDEAYKIEKAIVKGKLKPIARASKIMQNGTPLDRTGVYSVDGIIYDFCEYTETRGGLPRIKCYQYASLKDFYAFSFPLPRHRWHE